MNGQLYQIPVQHEACLTSPNIIYYRRDQRDGGDTKIGWPCFLIADRRKSKAIEQSTNADGSEDRQGNGTEDRLELDQQKGGMADRHLYHRKEFQHIHDVKAENKIQRVYQQKLRYHHQAHGQGYVLDIKAEIGRHHKPFFLQIAGHHKQHQNTVGYVIADLQPYADLWILPDSKSQKGHKHGKQYKNPNPTGDQ